MNNFQHLLEKFAKLVQSPALVKQPIIAAIETATKIKLLEGDINLKDRIIYVTSSPSVRNEVFMRKRLILEELQRTIGETSPTDIR